jgi:hypothetical protein
VKHPLLARFLALLMILLPATVLAHGVSAADAAFVQAGGGVQFLPFLYLGAKHMVTGYDHLLFLAGVIFFLSDLRHVVLYATLFAIGHSLTLLGGVLFQIRADAHLVDALIGLSVAYKAFENLGGFRALGISIDARAAVLAFGLVHGFGLATKLQELELSPRGLAANLVGFNVGVEVGQVLALALMVLLLQLWRTTRSFDRLAVPANVAILAAGFLLTGYQLAAFTFERG